MKKKIATPETKVVCPKCGTEFAIAEREHLTIGIAIGKDSGLGTISPAVSGQTDTPRKTLSQMKAEAKIEALRNAGVDVDNLFSMKNPNGQDNVVRLKNGVCSVVPDDDPIYKAIIENGTIPNPRLFRRWVMAQVFHMMTYNYNGESGFTAALQAKGYKYQWKMVLEELRVQAKLAENDPENFKARNHWFDADRVCEMCNDYTTQLVKHIKKMKVRHCKGIPYVKFRTRNVFVSDIESKVFAPLSNLADEILSAERPVRLYYLVYQFVNLAKDLWMENSIPMSAVFKDSYKGAGAYFTMKNLILFHGAIFKNGCCKYSQKKSLETLEEKAQEYHYEGWRLFGVMKKLIADSNINIKKKMAEWRK